MYKKLLKISTSLFLMVTLVSLFCGCSNTSQSAISGKKLLAIENCKGITLSTGSTTKKLDKQADIDTIVNLLSSLDYKKTSSEDIEGGISLTINTSNADLDVNVCGKSIKYNNQWYETSEDISDKLHAYMN